jgi:peptidoglycan/xylan/chitin deacetylase (PgdA/CDA1 family)
LSAGELSGPAAWGPARRPAAVAITFDNLGEAAELERRQWPAGEPLGEHFSVTRGLPSVLALLAEFDLRATFFVEGINAELYPEALAEIAAAGHEVALHGWRHEDWTELDWVREGDLLRRASGALASLGVRPVGFRPPGGRLGARSPDALADAGFAYCSPAGAGAGVRGELAVLPFRWRLIDAFHYLPSFASRRSAVLGSPDVLTPAALRTAVGAALAEATRDRSFLAVLFHPFLADAEERVSALRAALSDIHSLLARQAIWCAPMREIAAWMLEQPGASAWDLRLDED